jgi:hypothetical protein
MINSIMTESTTKHSKWGTRIKLFFLLILILSIFISVFTIKYAQHKNVLLLESEQSMKHQELELVELRNEKQSGLNEYNRCQEFVLLKSGEFAEFQYCERFIEWHGGK